MVSITKLSSHNINSFQNLCQKNLKQETYDKDFFYYYRKQSFIPKVLMKKNVRLFIYEGRIIGYMWHDMPINYSIKLFSLYIESEYLGLIDDRVLKSYNNNKLIYEAVESKSNNILVERLGFQKVKALILMELNLVQYNKNSIMFTIKQEIQKSEALLKALNMYCGICFDVINISFDVVKSKRDIILRCEIQNNIFNDNNRFPLTIEDIENDVQQDYYIDSLAIFLKINDVALGYGQIIYDKDTFTVVNFGILKQFRGFGLSKILLDNLIQRAKMNNIENLALRVEEENEFAVNLYNWIGFEEQCYINKWER